jgi:hypothetical protein
LVAGEAPVLKIHLVAHDLSPRCDEAIVGSDALQGFMEAPEADPPDLLAVRRMVELSGSQGNEQERRTFR